MPEGKSRLSSFIFLMMPSAAASALVPGRWKMASATAGLPFEVRVRDVVAGAELDTRHVADAHEAPAVGGLDDHLPELAHILETPLRLHGELEGGIRRRGLLAERTARDLDVLLLQGTNDIGGGELIGGEPVRIEPDADRVFAGAEELDVADAVEAQQLVADADRGVVRDVELVVAVVRRQHVNDHHQVGRALARGHAEPAHLVRQARRRRGDAVLDQHVRLVEVRCRA